MPPIKINPVAGKNYQDAWDTFDSNVDESIIDLDTNGTQFRLKKFDGTYTSFKAITFPVQTAANGLTLVGSSVRLGGTLTGSTSINTSSFEFVMQNGVGAQRLRIGNSWAELAGALELRISPPSIDASSAVVGQILELQATTGRVEWSFRNKIKQRNTAINTTLTTSDYMLVTTANPLTVTLPLAPVDGQNFIIKSISASVPSPVTINGNGKNIDTAATRLHTVSNQSTTLVFNSALNRWLII